MIEPRSPTVSGRPSKLDRPISFPSSALPLPARNTLMRLPKIRLPASPGPPIDGTVAADQHPEQVVAAEGRLVVALERLDKRVDVLVLADRVVRDPGAAPAPARIPRIWFLIVLPSTTAFGDLAQQRDAEQPEPAQVVAEDLHVVERLARR